MPVFRKSRSTSQATFTSMGFPLPSDNVINTFVKIFTVTAVGKIHNPRLERLLKLKTPWLAKK